MAADIIQIKDDMQQPLVGNYIIITRLLQQYDSNSNNAWSTSNFAVFSLIKCTSKWSESW